MRLHCYLLLTPFEFCILIDVESQGKGVNLQTLQRSSAPLILLFCQANIIFVLFYEHNIFTDIEAKNLWPPETIHKRCIGFKMKQLKWSRSICNFLTNTNVFNQISIKIICVSSDHLFSQCNYTDVAVISVLCMCLWTTLTECDHMWLEQGYTDTHIERNCWLTEFQVLYRKTIPL